MPSTSVSQRVKFGGHIPRQETDRSPNPTMSRFQEKSSWVAA